MSAGRDKLWYLVHDRGGELREIDIELDVIDLEINALQRIGHEETKARLDALGIDTSKFRPPPPLHRSEQRCTNHPAGDEIESLILEAQESKLDKVYREHLAEEEIVETGVIRRYGCGQVLGVR